MCIRHHGSLGQTNPSTDHIQYHKAIRAGVGLGLGPRLVSWQTQGFVDPSSLNVVLNVTSDPHMHVSNLFEYNSNVPRSVDICIALMSLSKLYSQIVPPVGKYIYS